MKKISLMVVCVMMALMCIITACSDSSDEEDSAATGTIQFYANGEDFVRQGFVSKDGWNISFDHVYITLSNISAYQTDPPYDPHGGGEIKGGNVVKLTGIHTVDLAQGDENADPIFVGEVRGVEPGHYNAISWKMDKSTSGPSAGYALMMAGTAKKDDQIEDFSITIDALCDYSCGEFVGDERKGFVVANGTDDLEMTFHFDHLFGDADLPSDDGLNIGALGFEALFNLPQGGGPDLNMAEMHLGHVGEGHCHCECE